MPFPEKTKDWATKNTMLAAQSYIFAAASHGLATAPMEGFDQERLKVYLGLPDRYALPLIVPTGYPDLSRQKNNDPSPRYPPEDVFFDDFFGKQKRRRSSGGEEHNKKEPPNE